MKQGTKVHDSLAIVLAFATGTLDAICFLALGKVFASVMTGNLVLLGLGLAQPDAMDAERAAVAIGAYMVGVAGGVLMGGRAETGQSLWPARVTVALGVEAVLLVGLATAWAVAGKPSTTAGQLGLLVLAAAGMGIQSAAVNRLALEGFTTTYLTSTLVRAVTDLITGPRRLVPAQTAALLAMLAGAAAGTALLRSEPDYAPWLTVGLLLAVITAATLLSREGEALSGRSLPAS